MRPLLTVLLTIAIAACAGWQVVDAPPTVSKQPAPAFFIAEAKATYFGGQGRLKGRLGLIAAQPDRLLIELRGPGGEPVSTFACDGDRITLFELEGPTFYHGPASPVAMARLLPLPIEPALAVALLRGDAPMPTAKLRHSTQKTAQRVEGEHPTLGRMMVTRYSPQHLHWALPDEAIEVTLKDRKTDGVFRSIHIKSGDDEVMLQLADVRVDGEAPPRDIFQLTAPPGATVRAL